MGKLTQTIAKNCIESQSFNACDILEPINLDAIAGMQIAKVGYKIRGSQNRKYGYVILGGMYKKAAFCNSYEELLTKLSKEKPKRYNPFDSNNFGRSIVLLLIVAVLICGFILLYLSYKDGKDIFEIFRYVMDGLAGLIGVFVGMVISNKKEA